MKMSMLCPKCNLPMYVMTRGWICPSCHGRMDPGGKFHQYMDKIPGACEVDKAAHRVFIAAGRDDDIIWRPSGVMCGACGTELGTYYCEEHLYMVRCRGCQKVTLIKSSNPRFAAEETR